MAGLKGFDDDLNSAYAREIDKYFRAYKNHPLIEHLRGLKPQLDEAPWEIPAVAVHLGQPPELKPLVDFDDASNADGWESRELFDAKFVALLGRFYREAKVEDFFRSQARYYAAVDGEYDRRGARLNKAWFGTFFGLKTTEDYYAIVALGMRDGSYMRVNFPKDYRHTFTIYETTAFDDRGLPTTFTDDVYPRMMMHEYVHAFANQLVDRHVDELQTSAETILAKPRVFAAMENTFYGNWRYLLYESLVRSCSIKYMMAHKGEGWDPEKEIASQEKAGFFWMRGLIEELDEYEANRAKYRNLEEYMPRLVAFFEETARKN